MSETIRILFIGDIVGNPGRRACQHLIPQMKAERGITAVVANAENAAHGSGLTRVIVDELFNVGVDIITAGDHIYKNADIYEYLHQSIRIVRPLNFSPDAIGKGMTVYECGGCPVAVISLLGHVFIQVDQNPFLVIDYAIHQARQSAQVILVEVHAEATSEKIAMGWYLDGKVSAVIGTHTHVQTADERVLPKGTAYITDAGMTGPFTSVIGREIEPVLKRFRTSMPAKFDVAKDDVRLSGVIVDVDTATGRALGIERVCVPLVVK